MRQQKQIKKVNSIRLTDGMKATLLYHFGTVQKAVEELTTCLENEEHKLEEGSYYKGASKFSDLVKMVKEKGE